MKLSLRVSAKWLDFLDGLTELNANDVMWQWLEVYFDTPLATRQSLWVTYTHKKYGEHTHEILFAEDSVGRVAKSHIPPEVIKIAGEWTLQIFIRQYSITDTSKYTQAGTNKVTFTVADGLPLDADDAPVNNETIASLYEKAKQIIEGSGIDNVTIENNMLTITLTDGRVIEAGNVKGEQGDDYILTDTDKTDIATEAASLIKESSQLLTYFEGSRAEYETAYASGAITVGSLVVITDITDEDTSGGSGDNTNPDITTAILGKAILGQMILGKGD